MEPEKASRGSQESLFERGVGLPDYLQLQWQAFRFRIKGKKEKEQEGIESLPLETLHWAFYFIVDVNHALSNQ